MSGRENFDNQNTIDIKCNKLYAILLMQWKPIHENQIDIVWMTDAIVILICMNCSLV